MRTPKLSSKESLKKTMLATVTKQTKTTKPKTMQEGEGVFVPDDACFVWEYPDVETEEDCEEQWGWFEDDCDEYWT